MSFRLKTIFGIALIELSVMLILITINQLNYGGAASTQLYQRVRGTGQLFATMVADAVIATDLATLDAIIENTLANDELVYVRVRTPTGNVISQGGDTAALGADFRADSTFNDALDDHRVDLSAPILIAGQQFGTIELGVSTLDVESEMTQAFRLNVLVAILGMSLVAVFGYVLGSVLTRQLSTLRQGALTIAQGSLDHRVPIRGRDELAETAQCFNQMAESLAREQAELERKQDVLLENKDRVERIVDCMTQIAEGMAQVEVPDTKRTDEIGAMARATVVFRDAMDEVERSRQEQARLIQAFDQLDEQVAIFDTSGRSIFQNTSFRSFNADILDELSEDFSYASFLATGLACGAFPGAAGQEDAWLERRLAEAEIEALPVEIARAPDRTLLVRQTSVTGIGRVVSASDVTELRTSQAQLIQASKLATLGEMATGIAHELNQPLGVIRMASNNCIKRIAKGHLDAEYLTGKLERMADQTERAAQIINHMRVFGRTADNEERSFDVIESLHSACALMRQQLSVHGIQLIDDLPDYGVSSLGQQVMFEQVILNLISNARDAIESHVTDATDSKEIRVSCSRDTQADVCSILVEDTGGGIPETVLDRLFDPFFTTKEPGKGTGLGLSISYGIVRDMNGTIAATNTKRGARFRIDVPTVNEVDAKVVNL